MYKYVAVALMIGMAEPAWALDVGVGGKVGGLGVGAGVSAGPQGASAGVGASVGGVGGANVGGSVGTGNGSVGVGVDAGGNVGSTSVGVDAGGNVGSTSSGVSKGIGGSATATAATAGSPASDNTATGSAKSAMRSINLPSTLRPSNAGRGESGRISVGYPFGPLESLKAKPGAPPEVVSACRAAIVSAAKPLGAVRTNVVSAGAIRQNQATLMAPIEVRIQYANQSGIQVRQAKVICRLDRARRVIAVT